MVIVPGILILYYFVGPYDHTRIMYTQDPAFTMVLGVIFFGLFFFGLTRILVRPTEIILSDEGIKIRHHGWNHWEYISSVRTIYEKDTENSNDMEYLVVYLKDGTSIKCIISDLDKSTGEILYFIRQFRPELIINGHGAVQEDSNPPG
ncbi:MAG: hypothetical protein JNM19_09395, partial [Chitinophagaceae bacterium]|nr:hypothetical protein [Chitinophagaceae bacterium]